MGERERLALFNMIGEFLLGAVVLDACAGSGALGIEALSRGADKVVFVEKSPQAVRVIRENLQDLGIEADVISGDVVNFTTDKLFDVILADPPYDDFRLADVEHLTELVQKGGLLVLSHPDNAPELPTMNLEKSRSYAGARISVYRKMGF